MTVNRLVSYFGPDGKPTLEGEKYFKDLALRLNQLEAFQEALAAVTAPTTGALQDAEARTAITNIIASAE